MDTLLLYLFTFLVGIFSMFILIHNLMRGTTTKAVKLNLPPEAGGAWPIIGHLHIMRASNLPHKTLGSVADKYGPIFTIRLGLHPAVVVSSSELAKECYTTNDLAIASRPKLVSAKFLGYDYAMFGFAPYGPYWREMRKIVTLELLSNRRLELLKHVRISEVDTSMKELYKLWRETVNRYELGKNSENIRSKDQGLKVEMKQWLNNLTLNIVLRMVAGKRYFGSYAERDKKEATRCQKAIREFFHLIGLFTVGDALPFLGWLDLGGHEKAMKELAKELDSICSEWLEEHKRKRASGEVDEGQKDFMDVMLILLDDKNLSAGFDADTIIKSASLSLVAGGTDTNMVTITWALSLLLNRPQVLMKAQEELDLEVGKQRVVDESDISKLVYLQAIVKETLRLHPPGPLSGPREFTKDCTIGGYHVPKGSRLIMNQWKIHHDPRNWSDPYDFRPERFLTTHMNVDVRGQNFELIPFSSGRRACPGTNMGLQVIHLVLARLLQGFNISNPSDAPVDMSEIYGLTTIKAMPLEVLVAPRLPDSLYE